MVATCRALIGADGWFSAIRQQLLADGPPIFKDSVRRGVGWLSAEARPSVAWCVWQMDPLAETQEPALCLRETCMCYGFIGGGRLHIVAARPPDSRSLSPLCRAGTRR